MHDYCNKLPSVVCFGSGLALTNKTEYLEKSVTAFQAAVTCKSTPPSRRFNYAKSWVRCVSTLGHESALEAYQAVIEFLPHMAMVGLNLQARWRALTSGSDGLACDAAACAIRWGQYEKAVKLLEEGRAVFWSQALQLCSPMTTLRDVAPELEADLRRISIALEQGSLHDVSQRFSDNHAKAVLMNRKQFLSSISTTSGYYWLATLDQVRCHTLEWFP
jgi:hypothetical protein